PRPNAIFRACPAGAADRPGGRTSPADSTGGDAAEDLDHGRDGLREHSNGCK
ncbi:unnamed protein product, partial [Symbiodinium microadriaticum]